MTDNTLWWTICGVCGKKFEVQASKKLTNKQIELVFIEKHNVHLFPTRCEEHYDVVEIYEEASI